MTYDIFISHSSADKLAAEEVAEVAREAVDGQTVTPFYFENDKDGLGRISERLVEMIRESKALVVVLTTSALRSGWVPFEIGVAKISGKEILIYIPDSPAPAVRLPGYLADYRRATTPEELTDELRRILDPPGPRFRGDFVLTVGGANGEYTLRLNKDGFRSTLERGEKHEVRAESLLGGSGVNYTLKLLSCGIPTLPILAIGNDELGREIKAKILHAIEGKAFEDQVRWFVERSDFFVPGLKTPRSTIAVDGDSRTIFKEQVETAERFYEHLGSRLETLNDHVMNCIKAVMIGHLTADGFRSNVSCSDTCTGRIIEHFSARNRLIFANIGDSQIRNGYDYWEPVMKKVDILQLNLNEMRGLFEKDKSIGSLGEIIGSLIKNQKVSIITLDKFGAISTYGAQPNVVYLAWPFDLDVVDTTGAGDAFGSGVVSALYDHRKLNQGTISNAVDEGRLWAAFTCTHLGGSSMCPSPGELATFMAAVLPGGAHPVHVADINGYYEIFRILDKSY